MRNSFKTGYLAAFAAVFTLSAAAAAFAETADAVSAAGFIQGEFGKLQDFLKAADAHPSIPLFHIYQPSRTLSALARRLKILRPTAGKNLDLIHIVLDLG